MPLKIPTNAVRHILEPYLPGTHGGGGDHSPLPASRGQLPRVALQQFTPPQAAIYNLAPKLPMEPTIIVAPDVNLPPVDLAVFGDPNAPPGPPSNGRGGGGGIGDGCCGGVGPGHGPGYGPDPGAGLVSVTGQSTHPALIYKVEPEFSEEARKAKLQGVVILYAEVDINGRLRNIKVTRSLGLGLDEKAIEAVKQWRFRPASRNGKPVVEAAAIEVNFHLL